MWKVHELGLKVSSKKRNKKARNVEDKRVHDNPEEKRSEKVPEDKVEKGGSVKVGIVEERRRIFEENDIGNLLLNTLTKHEVAPQKKLSLEENLMSSLKKNPKKNNEMKSPPPLTPRKISAIEKERYRQEDFIMGISPRSKTQFKIKQASGNVKQMKKVFEGASPLTKVRNNISNFNLFAVEIVANSVSANQRRDVEASLGTDLRRTLVLDGLSRKMEIGPTGKGLRNGSAQTGNLVDSSKTNI